MRRFGPNLFGDALQPGRITRLHLGIVVDQPLARSPLLPGSMLLVTPPGLLDRKVGQLDGRLLYDLATGHPGRVPGDLLFLADLTQELWAWDGSTWTKRGVDPERISGVVADGHRRGHLDAVRVDDLTAEELRSLEQLPLTARRDQLRRRLQDRLHPHATRRPHPSTSQTSWREDCTHRGRVGEPPDRATSDPQNALQCQVWFDAMAGLNNGLTPHKAFTQGMTSINNGRYDRRAFAETKADYAAVKRACQATTRSGASSATG